MSSCPSCNGARQSLTHIHYANRVGEWRMEACWRCGGSGEITEADAAKIAEGEALRRARIAAGRGLTVEAARLGVTPQLLSKAEHGLAELPAAAMEA